MNNRSSVKETLAGSRSLFIHLNCAIFIFTLLLNGFAIWIFTKNKTLLRVVSNKILLSLAVGDFLSGSVIGVHLLITLIPSLSSVTCRGCIVLRIFTDMSMTVLVNVDVLHMLGIATDRYLGLFYALRYEQMFTAKKAKVFITTAWSLSIVFSMIQIFWIYPALDGISVKENHSISNCDAVFSSISFIVFMFIPMLALAVLFTMMFREIRRLLHSTPTLSNTSQCYLWAEFRASTVFVAMFMTFATLSVPYYVVRLLIDIKHLGQIFHIEIEALMYQVAYVMKNLAPISNPLLYIICNQDFRQAIRKVFRQITRKLSESRSTASIRFETSKQRKRTISKLSESPSTTSIRCEMSMRRKKAVSCATNYSSVSVTNMVARKTSKGEFIVFASDIVSVEGSIPILV